MGHRKEQHTEKRKEAKKGRKEEQRKGRRKKGIQEKVRRKGKR